MGIGVVEALSRPYPCPCDCFHTLSPSERADGVRAMYRLDDALRGWGYQTNYDFDGHQLFLQAKMRNDTSYRGVAMRDEACGYRRLVGFALHELIHALSGDVTQANYGIPFGAPYGVPADLPPSEEKAWLEPFNRGEARAWVGVAPLARALFGIEWTVRTARDVGTYGFPGGNALVEVPPGFRPVPHYDRVAHEARYYALARKIEDEERAWFAPDRLPALVARVEEAEALGRRKRKGHYPEPEELAAIEPKMPGRNEPCLCGSGKKHKACCGSAR